MEGTMTDVEDDDELERMLDECGLRADGGCDRAMTTYCDFRCPMRPRRGGSETARNAEDPP